MIVTVKKIRKDAWSGKFSYRDENKTKIGIPMKWPTGELAIPFSDAELKEWETKLGYAAGHLARYAPFWKNYTVALGREERFDTDILQHEFDLAVLKANKKFAKSYAEVSTNAYAEYVIHDEEQAAKVYNISKKDVKKAWAVLDKLSPEDMRKVLLQYGTSPFSLSGEVVEQKLGELIDSDPKRFILIATDELLELKDNIQTAVHYGIMEFRGQVYSYGSTVFGELQETAKMLKTKEYAETLVSILKQINAAKNKDI